MLKIIKDSTLVPTPIVDLKLDSEPRQGSTDPVTSEGVKSAIDGAVGDASAALQQQIDEIAEKAGSGYIPKGEANVATLNGLSDQENGDLYTMTDAGTLTDGSLAVVAGDTVAWDATNEVWYKAMAYAPRQYGTNEVHNLPTTITAFRTGDYIAVDGTDTAKMSKDDLLRVTAENAVDSGVAASYDKFFGFEKNYYTTANATTVIGTGLILEKNSLYKITFKTATLCSTAGTFSCLYSVVNGTTTAIGEATSAELYAGKSFYIQTDNNDWEIKVRTYQSGIACRVTAAIYTDCVEIGKELYSKVNVSDISKSYIASGTASVTNPISTGIELKKGYRYRIYAKCSGVDLTTLEILYNYYTEGGQSNIYLTTGWAAEDGIVYDYTCDKDGILYIRTRKIGATYSVNVLGNAIDSLNASVNSVRDVLYSKINKSVTTDSTTTKDTNIRLTAGVAYRIKMKTTTQVSEAGSFPCAYFFPTTGAYEEIERTTAAELYAGIEFSYTPASSGYLKVRAYEASITFEIEVIFAESLVKDQMDHKVWACYGDSITAISNGDGLNIGWAEYVNQKIPFANFYGRGVGGQRIEWVSGGGSVTFVNATTGNYNSRNDSYNKDNYTGAIPDGCVAVRGCFCSWDRITHMFPASIKDTIDVLCIMGGTNSTHSDTDAEFIANDTTDTEWATSGVDYYGKFGGDYNIGHIKGAIASMVMKFQVWMPNAIIILCTPLSGRGTTGEVSTDLNVAEYAKAQDIKEMAERTSCPCIDVFGTCGISPFNRTEYISDSVHPYLEAGKKMLARSFIMGLKNIEPNL